MIFNFAACTNDAETTSNELAGKTFVCDTGNCIQTCIFDDDTFSITYQFDVEGLSGIYENYTCKQLYTYSYSLNSDFGYILAKEKSIKETFERNNKTLYTEPEMYPATYEEFINNLKAFYKALNPALDDDRINELVKLDNLFNESNYDREKYIVNVKNRKYRREFFNIIPYRLENTKLLLGYEDSDIIPYDLNFEDIFNGRYYYFSFDRKDNGSTPEFALSNNAASLAKTYPSIIINTDESDELLYSILSVKDNNMKIVSISESNRDSREVYIYNESEAFNCPITYTESKDKLTAKVKIKGKSYSFDIKYTSKKEIAELLKEDYDTYTLKD